MHFGNYKPDDDDIVRKHQEYIEKGHKSMDNLEAYLSDYSYESLDIELHKERAVLGFVMEMFTKKEFPTKDHVNMIAVSSIYYRDASGNEITFNDLRQLPESDFPLTLYEPNIEK